MMLVNLSKTCMAKMGQQLCPIGPVSILNHFFQNWYHTLSNHIKIQKSPVSGPNITQRGPEQFKMSPKLQISLKSIEKRPILLSYYQSALAIPVCLHRTTIVCVIFDILFESQKYEL